MQEKKLSQALIGEAFGSFILVMLGLGVMAHVALAPRLAGTAYNWNTIAIGWGLAYTIAIYVTGGVSGAHINPAVTMALAVKRNFPWKKVLPYILAQVFGAFLGAMGVWFMYKDGLAPAGFPNIWATDTAFAFDTPAWGAANVGEPVERYRLVVACVAELFGTMMLIWGFLAAHDRKNLGLKDNFGPILVGLTVLAIGLSLGGPSGFAINPARDLGPRIWGAVTGTTGLFEGLYWLIPPIIIPLFAGPLAIVFYDLFITHNLSKAREIGLAGTPEEQNVEKPGD